MFNLFKSDKKEDNYFNEFEEIAELILKINEILSSSVKDDKLLSLEKELDEVKKTLATAREKKQKIMHQLYEDFLPPIDRQDIIEITQSLIKLLETMGNLLFRIDSYQIKSTPDDVLTFVNLLEDASLKNLAMIKELSHFKKAKKSFQLMNEMKDIKVKEDSHYYSAIKKLYTNEGNSFENLRSSKVYDDFDKVFYSFEELSDSIGTMIVKNS